MTRFGPIEQPETYAVLCARGMRASERVWLEHTTPENQAVWLDGLVERHHGALNLATLLRESPHPAISWFTYLNPEEERRGVVELRYWPASYTFVATSRRLKAWYLGSTIEDALHRAFDPEGEEPLFESFETGQERSELFARGALGDDNPTVLSAAAAFFAQADEIVRDHGGRRSYAWLDHGSLSLIYRGTVEALNLYQPPTSP
ncbi:MAG: hypothetical protein ACMXYM_00045 [Candidatus Woesearchaeota archaeon]